MKLFTRLSLLILLILAPFLAPAQISFSLRPAVLYDNTSYFINAFSKSYPKYYYGLELGASLQLGRKFQVGLQSFLSQKPPKPSLQTANAREFVWYSSWYGMATYRIGNGKLTGRIGLLAGFLIEHYKIEVDDTRNIEVDPSGTYSSGYLSMGPVGGLDWRLSEHFLLSSELKLFINSDLTSPIAIYANPMFSLGVTWRLGKERNR